MRDFAYRTPQDLAEAVSSLRQSDAEILAGGTELLNWMRLGISAPAALVDIGRIENGFSAIELRGDSLCIGARATLSKIGENPVVRQSFRVLSEACLKAASPQVRNRATLGGNVLQKTRCAYFRAGAPLPWGCNKREPGSGCAARNGLNERHAILGWTDACVATQPSDPAVALACLDAAIELIGPNGSHRMPLTAFHLTQQEAAGRGSDAAGLENQLAPGELIAAFHIPLRQRQRSAYVKVRERESFEYALVSAAATLDLDDGTIRSARIALGSVAQKPWRLPAAETALSGIRPSREAVLPPIRAALAEARALEHNAYKIEMAANAATRAVLIAGGAA
jgi:xanthine dehydrogenase YagS FAD-binding subunit